jgi:hypothetical protein
MHNSNQGEGMPDYDLPYTVYDEERGLYILNLGEEHLLVNEEGLFVIDLIKKGMSPRTIQGMFETRFGRSISEEEVRDSRTLLEKLEAPSGERSLEIPLISDLHRYTKGLSFLSTWLINIPVGIGIGLFLMAALWQMYSHFDAFLLSGRDITGLSAWGWIFCLIYMLCAVLFHEIMHVLACEKYGVAPGACGFRLKLIFPFLYIDIPSSWECSQKARVIISAAGPAANMIFLSAAVFTVLYSSLSEQVQTALVVTVYSNMLTTLAVANPFMKEDGYNIVSDILKIPNLMPRAIEYLKSKMKGEDFEYLSSHEKIVFPLYASGLVVFRIVLYGLTAYILYRVAMWIVRIL